MEDFHNTTEAFSIVTSNDSISIFEEFPMWKQYLTKFIDVSIPIHLVIIMLTMGCIIECKQIVKNLWPPIGILTGMAGQFIFLPAFAYGLITVFQLKPYEALGCLIMACSPGGTFSNYFTYWFDGDVALSVVMTTCSTLVAFGMMPLNLWLYTRSLLQSDDKIVVPYFNIVVSLIFVCAPVIVGMLIRHFKPNIADRINQIFAVLTYVVLIIIVACALVIYSDKYLHSSPSMYAIVLILPTTGMVSAYLFAFILRFPQKQCRTIGIETGTQNLTVTLGIIIMSFSEEQIRSDMMTMPLLYSGFQMVELTIGVAIFQGIKKWRSKYIKVKKNIPLYEVKENRSQK